MVLGISYDTPEDNKTFAENEGFPFLLLSNTDHSVGIAYEVERDEEDRFRGVPRRITYVIDPEGIIRLAYVIVTQQIASHPDRVLADLTSLKGL